MIYLLDGITKRRTITNPEARKCLQLVEQSFMFFDSTADGCIERKELAYALKSGTKVQRTGQVAESSGRGRG